jgi:hypothetical protein
MRAGSCQTSAFKQWTLSQVRSIVIWMYFPSSTIISIRRLLFTLSRYIDDVFMTINLLSDDMQCILDRENTKDDNIRITISMGKNVEFLNVSADNRDGLLVTKAFHKPAAEPCYIALFVRSSSTYAYEYNCRRLISCDSSLFLSWTLQWRTLKIGEDVRVEWIPTDVCEKNFWLFL